MSFAGLMLIAIGVSADAFAVALTMGVKMRQFSSKYIATIALVFGGFQALMPLIGWFLGDRFLQYISAVDHWVAFALLLFVGGKMLKEAFEREEPHHEIVERICAACEARNEPAQRCSHVSQSNELEGSSGSTSTKAPAIAAVPAFTAGSLVLLGVAESIDALAVGITFPVSDVNVWSAIALIGVVTTVLSAFAVWIGHKLGSRFSKPAEIVGGVILIGLGVQILCEHLG